MAAALIAGTGVGVLLGYVQVITGQFGQPSWYMYEESSVGSAVGFFANRNHMGTLLLMTFPFVVALTFGRTGADPRLASSRKLLGVLGALLIILGLASNGSLAALVLAVPIMAFSAMLIPGLKRIAPALAAFGGAALLCGIVFLANSPVQSKLTGESTSSFEGRWDLWQHTATIIRNTFPYGTGIGSFQTIYPLYEQVDAVSGVYANNAHNDYIEVIAEGGVAGVLLMIAGAVWWWKQARASFGAGGHTRLAAAATIASGAALAHSLVDYPLRTTALTAVFAFCLSVMASVRPALKGADASATADTALARHRKIG
jgi:O-antigen ligase